MTCSYLFLMVCFMADKNPCHSDLVSHCITREPVLGSGPSEKREKRMEWGSAHLRTLLSPISGSRSGNPISHLGCSQEPKTRGLPINFVIGFKSGAREVGEAEQGAQSRPQSNMCTHCTCTHIHTPTLTRIMTFTNVIKFLHEYTHAYKYTDTHTH